MQTPTERVFYLTKGLPTWKPTWYLPDQILSDFKCFANVKNCKFFIKNLLGTTLPGFRSYKPPWLRLSERPWDHKPPKETKLLSMAGAPPLHPLLYPAWPQA